MSYSLQTLWFERQRYLPGVLAVAFSALLIALQCGLLLGLFSITSLPIDQTDADVWVGYPKVPSVDLGRPFPVAWESYVNMPEVEHVEPYLQGFAYWDKPSGGAELCVLIGSRLNKGSLGAIKELTLKQRQMLSEPGAVIVDESEFDRLGIKGVGSTAEVSGQRVHVVDTVRGMKSLAGPYVFCSLETARARLRMNSDQTMFLLVKCHREEDAQKVVDRLEPYRDKLEAFTSPSFSLHSRLHWLTKTKAGIALGLAAALGLLVGAVVTSQTLYAATAAQLREYAVLRAMGIPRWRMALTVLAQSFWVGVAGVVLAVPTAFLLQQLGDEAGAKILLPWWLVTFSVVLTLAMALLSGLAALRSLRLIEPVNLLR
jgi:putative ABC transport system permease protein